MTQPEPEDAKAQLASHWLKLAIQYLQVDNYSAAFDAFENALALNPNDQDAWGNRGIALGNLGRYEEAIASFDKVIAIKPDSDRAWNERGIALFNLGRYEEAIASCDKAIAIQPDSHEAWNNRGVALRILGCYEEAIVSCNKAIAIQPNFHQIWNNRGVVQFNLGQIEEALASFDKALEIQPDYYEVWNGRGQALDKLGRHESAIADYTKAIELKPDYPDAWNGRGVALFFLGRYQEAISDFKQALDLTQGQLWLAWQNLGNLLLNYQGYEAAQETWQEGLQQLHPEIPEYQEGCGELYHSKGKAYYDQGRHSENPFPFWRDAKRCYCKALASFEILASCPANIKARERYLTILQDFIIVCRGLGGEAERVQELLGDGSDLLQRLLQDIPSAHRKIQLARKFAGFTQLQVDQLVQSGQAVKALELAEERKNVCLGWLRYGWSDEPPPSPNSLAIEQLLKPHTAVIYWHLSPSAITTFLLRYNQPSRVYNPKAKANDATYPPAVRQIRDLEEWVKAWKDNYQDYRARQDQGLENHPWRQDMTEKLEELKNILKIPVILQQLAAGIRHLILIPHRDLHLLPLHYLFPEDFTITYLPSAQIGLDLQQFTVGAMNELPLLSVEYPSDRESLLYAELESAAICQLYGNPHRIPGTEATKQTVKSAVELSAGIFHFTGHCDHNLDSPSESALLLANRELLTLQDIFQLDLHSYDLICLSACETGMTSKSSLVDEYVSLVSVFLAMGATYVVSSLWRVEEISTALIMIEFYHQLARGLTPASALKQAQMWLRSVTYAELVQWYLERAEELREYDPHRSRDLKESATLIQNDTAKMASNQPPYSHLYYWAGFTMAGKISY